MVVSASLTTAQSLISDKPPREFTNLYMGGKLGGTINNITFAGAETVLGSRTFKGLEFGTNVGVVLRWEIMEYLSLQVEPGYMKRGYFNKYKTRESTPIIYNEQGDLHYFDLPVTVRGRYGGSLVKAYGEFGFSYGYLFTGERTLKFLDPDGNVESVRKQGFKDRDDSPFDYNFHNVALIYGWGLEFDTPNSVLTAGVSYHQSLLDIQSLRIEPDNYNSSHNTWVFHVSYVFQLPRFEYNLKRSLPQQ